MEQKYVIMAIKLINALRNLNIEEKHEEIEKAINFLVSNCKIDSSVIEPSLLLSDYHYLQLEDAIRCTTKVQELERESMGIPWGIPEADEMLEKILNRLIPNRELSKYTKYRDLAKKIMSTAGNSEQIKTTTTNVTSESRVDGSTDNDNMSSIQWKWPENYYGINVSDEDKNTFENYLYELCKGKKKRSLTKDVVDYLKFKEKQNIIKRPKQTNTEFEIVKKFGYPFQLGAYYKA